MALTGFTGHVEGLLKKMNPTISLYIQQERLRFLQRWKAGRIRRAIEEKKNPSLKKPTRLDPYGISSISLSYALMGTEPYHQRTLEELEGALKTLAKTSLPMMHIFFRRKWGISSIYFTIKENSILKMGKYMSIFRNRWVTCRIRSPRRTQS